MSENTKYVMEKGKFILHQNSEEFLAENSARPTHWGDLVIPDGCKAGDTIKLSAWRGTSKAGNSILNGKCELRQMPEHVGSTDNAKEEF